MAEHDYQEEEYYEEDFPEPEVDAPKAKKKPNTAMLAAGGLGLVAALGAALYLVAPDNNPLALLPPEVTAMIPGMAPEATPAPEADIVPPHPHRRPHRAAAGGTEAPAPAGAAETAQAGADAAQAGAAAAKSAQAAAAKAVEAAKAGQAAAASAQKAETAQVAGKPAAAPNDGWNDPTPVQKVHKPKHGAPAVQADPQTAEKPAAAAPAHVAKQPPMAPAHPKVAAAATTTTTAAAAKHAAPVKRTAIAEAAGSHKGAAAGHSMATEVGFASSSYWVSAAEMEKLWQFSSQIKDTSGQLTVVGYAGDEGGSSAELSRKRASRVAELLQKNNPGAAFKINVRAQGASGGGSNRRVKVTYSSSL